MASTSAALAPDDDALEGLGGGATASAAGAVAVALASELAGRLSLYMSRAPATATAAVMAAVRPDGTDEDMVEQQMHTNERGVQSAVRWIRFK